MSFSVPRMSESESRAWRSLVQVCELLPAALDAQLQRDSAITHFEYMVLSMLRHADASTLRMSHLAQATNATLPRLSHVVTRLEERGLVERAACPEDGRATNVVLTSAGRAMVVRATEGHLDTVRALVLDALTPAQVDQLGDVASAIGARLDPDRRFAEPAIAADD